MCLFTCIRGLALICGHPFTILTEYETKMHMLNTNDCNGDEIWTHLITRYTTMDIDDESPMLYMKTGKTLYRLDDNPLYIYVYIYIYIN